MVGEAEHPQGISIAVSKHVVTIREEALFCIQEFLLLWYDLAREAHSPILPLFEQIVNRPYAMRGVL